MWAWRIPELPAGEEVGEWGEGVLNCGLLGIGASGGAFWKWSCRYCTTSLVSLILILNNFSESSD